MPRPVLACLVALGLVAAACSGSGSGSGDGGGRGGAASSSTTATTTGAVTVADVAVEEGPHSTLSAVLTFTTSVATLPVVAVRGGGRSWVVPTRGASDEHEIPLVGLRAETEYEVTVGGLGVEEPAVATFTTGALPEGMPRFEVVRSDPSRMAPGVTMFDAIPLGGPDPATTPAADAPDAGWVLAVDAEGEVVWYYRAPQPIGDVRQLEDGHLLLEYDNLGAREIDVLGTTVREWAGSLVRGRLAEDRYGRRIIGDDAIPVETDSIHHEVGPLPGGNLLALSTELLDVPFPAPRCGEDPATFPGRYQLVSDVVVEFDPDTGEVVGEWPLGDLLDPVADPAQAAVCSFTSPTIVPTFMYASMGDVKDWSHANSVVLDEGRDALLVSVRHLDAVIAVDRATGELRWRLGPGGTLRMEGDGRWPYHQHAIHVLDDGDLLLYDNGNGRPVPPGTPPQSRAVRYEVDEEAGTVRQVWEYPSVLDGQPAFAFFVGDADPLPNGNVLIDDGGLSSETTEVSARLLEVDPADGPSGGDPVWELRLYDDAPDWAVYRAERLASLYGP
ncbi:MAG TPA: aryl-sulfate sulfotransferase [Acidimicrobiales bacterium]